MAKKAKPAPAGKFERIPVETGSAEWLKLRERDVTASRAPALLGIHEYETARGLYEEKVGIIRPKPESDAMRRGRLLEPVAMQILAEDHPRLKFEVPGVYCRDPEARLGATPDLWAYDPDAGFGVVQIKSVHAMIFRKKWFSDPDDESPLEGREVTPPGWVMVQGLIDAHVSEHPEYGRAKWAAVAPVVVDFGISCPLIRIDLSSKNAQAVLKNIYDATADFWQAVESKTPPEFDFSKDGERIAALYDAPKDGVIDLSKDNRIAAALDEYLAAGEREKAAAGEKKTLRAEIMTKLDGHEMAYVPGYGLTCKVQHRTEYTVKASSFPVLRASRKA